VTDQIRARPPLVHAGHPYLGLAWAALEWLESTVQPGMTTLETGTGASTVVFAARGASHVAISPYEDEHERIVSYCRERGIGTDGVRFIGESSHTALKDTWKPEPLDVALIDGAHGFPFPILDWSYVAPHLRDGGLLVVDDAYQPSVNVLVRYLSADPSWALEAVLGHRTPAFRKLDDAGLRADWDDEILGRPHFDYLPPAERLVAWLRYRVLERGPLQPLAQDLALRMRRRAGHQGQRRGPRP
jgi:hypothetical protein